MKPDYSGWCKRIDLSLRSKYPHLQTRIFKINNNSYSIYVVGSLENFEDFVQDFEKSIKFMTVPVQVVNITPKNYECEIQRIEDNAVPSQFEGVPFSIGQLSNHIECLHPGIYVSKIINSAICGKSSIEIFGEISESTRAEIEDTIKKLKFPFSFEVKGGGKKKRNYKYGNPVFQIMSSSSQRHLNAEYIKRDEELWFSNCDDVYMGKFKKDDLYFYKPNELSCLVDFSSFSNINLRNHLLLYDTIYCALPLYEGMRSFLENQKITRDDILYLIKKGRLKIINIQPESRLDHDFINKAYEVNPDSVISRRGIATLCAIDLVEMNHSYLLNDPDVQIYIHPLVEILSNITKQPAKTIAYYLLWPRAALRASFEALNFVGPMGIANYGVNNTILDTFLLASKKKDLEFDFTVNAYPVHLAHALDATYYPYYIQDNKYTNYPYTKMMGDVLNFYRLINKEQIKESIKVFLQKGSGNPSIKSVKIFEIVDYIPIDEFEDSIKNSILKSELRSLFAELSLLDEDERDERIAEYNNALDKTLAKMKVWKFTLDLGEDIIGMWIPFISSGKKLVSWLENRYIRKYSKLNGLIEYLEEKRLSNNEFKRKISLLSKINRVARLHKNYGD